MVSVRYCYSVRTNGEGWFRMHPPMHALYHLPNLVSHPTPQPISKPTPWRTSASKQAAFGQQRARAAGLFVPGFSEAGFGHVCTPPAHPPPQTLRFMVSTARHTHPPPSASHGMCHERGDCRQIDGRCQICIIRIACSCHSTLIHAHDMRFAACHPCT